MSVVPVLDVPVGSVVRDEIGRRCRVIGLEPDPEAYWTPRVRVRHLDCPVPGVIHELLLLGSTQVEIETSEGEART